MELNEDDRSGPRRDGRRGPICIWPICISGEMDWVEVQAIASAALVLTSAGAISYAALQLRHEREYRSVANLEKQLTYFLSEVFVAARRRLAAVRTDGVALRAWELENPPVEAFEVLDFYDHLGLLVRKGHLDVYDVWHTFYEWSQPVYLDMQKLVEDAESDFIDHYSELRRLMRSMDDIQLKRMHAQHANHWALWTPDRILEHYRYELEASQTSRRRRAEVRTRVRRPSQLLGPTGELLEEGDNALAGRE